MARIYAGLKKNANALRCYYKNSKIRNNLLCEQLFIVLNRWRRNRGDGEQDARLSASAGGAAGRGDESDALLSTNGDDDDTSVELSFNQGKPGLWQKAKNLVRGDRNDRARLSCHSHNGSNSSLNSTQSATLVPSPEPLIKHTAQAMKEALEPLDLTHSTALKDAAQKILDEMTVGSIYEYLGQFVVAHQEGGTITLKKVFERVGDRGVSDEMKKAALDFLQMIYAALRGDEGALNYQEELQAIGVKMAEIADTSKAALEIAAKGTAKLTAENEQLKQEMAPQEENDSVRKIVADLEAPLAQRDQALQDKEGVITALQEEIQSITHVRDTNDEQVRALQEQLNIKDILISDLQGQLTAEKTSASANKTKISALETQIASVTSEQDSEKKEHDELKDAGKMLLNAFRNKEAELNDKSQELTEAQALQAHTQTQLTTEQDAHAKAKQSIIDLDAAAATRNAENAELKKQLAYSKKQAEQFSEVALNLGKKMADLIDEKNTLKTQLQEKEDIITILNAERDGLKSKIEQDADAMQKMQGVINAKHKKQRNLEKELQTEKSKSVAHQMANKANIQSLEKQIASVIETNAATQAQYDALKSVSNVQQEELQARDVELGEKCGEVSALQVSLNKAMDDHDQYKTQAESTISDLRSHAKQLKNQARAYQSQISSLKSEKHTLEKDKKLVALQLSNAQKSGASDKSAIDSLQSQLTNYTARIAKKDDEIKDARKQKKVAVAAHQEVKNAMQSLPIPSTLDTLDSEEDSLLYDSEEEVDGDQDVKSNQVSVRSNIITSINEDVISIAYLMMRPGLKVIEIIIVVITFPITLIKKLFQKKDRKVIEDAESQTHLDEAEHEEDIDEEITAAAG